MSKEILTSFASLSIFTASHSIRRDCNWRWGWHSSTCLSEPHWFKWLGEQCERKSTWYRGCSTWRTRWITGIEYGPKEPRLNPQKAGDRGRCSHFLDHIRPISTQRVKPRESNRNRSAGDGSEATVTCAPFMVWSSHIRDLCCVSLLWMRYLTQTIARI